MNDKNEFIDDAHALRLILAGFSLMGIRCNSPNANAETAASIALDDADAILRMSKQKNKKIKQKNNESKADQ
jgi:hypothetical protein